MMGVGKRLTPRDVRRILEGILPPDLDKQTQLTVITALFERMNNVLYRQQGMAGRVVQGAQYPGDILKR